MVPNYQLLTKIQRMMTNSQPASTQLSLRALFWCNTAPHDPKGEVSILVTRRQRGRHASFHGVQHCHNPWSCPVCTAQMLTIKAAEVTQIIEAKKIQGLYPKMVTYTVPHNRRETAAEVLKKLQIIKRRYNRNLRYVLRKEFPSWDGTITSLECKYSAHFGWHWHYHVLYFFDAFDCVKFDNYESILTAYWRLAALQTLNLDMRYVSNITAGKNESTPVHISPGIVKDGSYLAKEVVKYDNGKKFSRSVFELAHSSDLLDNALFFEFALAARGKQRVQIGSHMRQYIDEEALKKNLSGNKHISTTLVCSWSAEDWSEIINQEFGINTGNEPSIRKKLLKAAELDGAMGVIEVCSELYLPYPKIHSKTIARDVVTEEWIRAELQSSAARLLNPCAAAPALIRETVEADAIYTPEQWRQRQQNIEEYRAGSDLFGLGAEGEQVTISISGDISSVRL